MEAFLVTLGLSLAVNAAFFAWAAVRKSDAVTDLSYGLSFALAAAGLVVVLRVRDPAGLAMAAMVVAWALRLALFLFARIRERGTDGRFDGRREDPWKFARFWILQALTVPLVMLPVALALAGGPGTPGLARPAGAALWAAGLALEAVADAQKAAFRAAGKPGFIATGLWAWSRHPNYFGEIILWWGLWLYALPSLEGPGAVALAALGPAYISALLLFVSGIPLLERRADARFGADQAYRDYKARVSVLVPLPPRGRKAGREREGGPDGR